MPSKVTFKLRLNQLVDTKGMKKSIKDEIKKEVGELLVDMALLDISKLKSPVNNQRFKRLKKEYREFKKKKGHSPIPNLELEGDMLDAFKEDSPKTVDKIEVGIFDFDQAQKADNHNKFSAKSKRTAVKKRQFIPKNKESETFRGGIMREAVRLAHEIKNRGE